MAARFIFCEIPRFARDDRIYIFRFISIHMNQSNVLPVILNEVKDLSIKTSHGCTFHIFVRSLALLGMTAATFFRSISVPTCINRDDRIYIFRFISVHASIHRTSCHPERSEGSPD